jgi:REP element-mobilizing transposase RayT
MPCYHFIFHAYGTWMPDEDDGYVRRGEGQLPQDIRAAAEYRKRMSDEAASFGEFQQRALIDEVQVAAKFQSFRTHFVATEPTHIHVLVSWQDEERAFEKLRASIRQSLSRRLGHDFGKREWLSEGGSRNRVSNQEHYDYLTHTYLPRHSGWKWCEEKGLFK